LVGVARKIRVVKYATPPAPQGKMEERPKSGPGEPGPYI